MTTQHTPEWPEFDKHPCANENYGQVELTRLEYNHARACVNELAGKPEGWVQQIENAYNHAAWSLQKAEQQHAELQAKYDELLKAAKWWSEQRTIFSEFDLLEAKYNESQRKLGAALLAESNAWDKIVQLEDLNEGMHQIIIKAGVGGGMTPGEVCAAFTELKRKVFGEATDE